MSRSSRSLKPGLAAYLSERRLAILSGAGKDFQCYETEPLTP